MQLGLPPLDAGQERIDAPDEHARIPEVPAAG
jgi:hypothetical protein